VSRRLLILACSQKKRAVPEDQETQAIQLYNGPLWQTLRTVDPQRKKAVPLFFSARYGLRDAACFIRPYDEQLTPESAQAAIARGLYGRLPARAPLLGYTFAASAIFCNANRKKPFTEICLVGGHLYLEVMRELVRLAQADIPEYVSRDAPVLEINGPIGIMRQRLRAWLDERRAK